MSILPDPRSLGFNYGPGWGSAPKPPIYQAAEKLAFDLSRAARAISDRAWALELKIRNVRLAHSREEKEAAVTQLAQEYAKYEVFLSEAIEAVCTIEGAVRAA